MSVLVLNAGSSSLKFAAYDAAEPAAPRPLLRGQIAGIGHAPQVSVSEGEPGSLAGQTPAQRGEPAEVFAWLLSLLGEHPAVGTPEIIGHRVVHGGREFAAPCVITPDILAQLDALAPLAPQHQPFNLAGVRQAADRWPDATQIACFDTAFHRSQPRIAQLFALPRALTEAGVLRYGFHGLSYEYIAGLLPERLGDKADGRVIMAHLGHGASLCALKNRRSVATTMGFTALDGLMMATRCGDLDPGVVLHLLQDGQGRSIAEVADILYARSGLLGVSGVSGDMRTLLTSEEPAAREAVDLFVHRIISAIGALAAQLEGLDALIFTAGVGEHAAPIRQRVVQGCAWLGARLDVNANEAHQTRFDAPDSAVALCVAHTNEELMIAQHAARFGPAQ